MIFGKDGFVRTRPYGEVGFAEKHVNIGVLAGSNAITCGYARGKLFTKTKKAASERLFQRLRF